MGSSPLIDTRSKKTNYFTLNITHFLLLSFKPPGFNRRIAESAKWGEWASG